MADGSSTYELEPSTLEYLKSPEIRVATANLLSAGTRAMPDGLDWKDVPRFYAALRASAMVKIDYAISLERFWHAVWDGVIKAPWTALTLDQQVEYDPGADNAVDDCFNEEYFTRVYLAKDKKHRLYTSVRIKESGHSIGVSLHKNDNAKSLLEVVDVNFEFKKAEGVWTRPLDEQPKAKIDVSLLRDLAGRAVDAATQILP